MKKTRRWRLKILYVLVVILVALSIVPLWFYGEQMVSMNRERLELQERELQYTVSKSLAQQISAYYKSTRGQVHDMFDTVGPLAEKTPQNKYTSDPDIANALGTVVTNRPSIIYATVLNDQMKGTGAQSASVAQFNIASDAFLRNSLDHAFIAAHQGQEYVSDPLTVVGPTGSQPVMVMARPLIFPGQFMGMVAAVVTLEPIVKDLDQTRQAGLEAYVVDRRGRIVASNIPNQNVAGIDLSKVPIVQRFKSLKGHARLAENTEFDLRKEHQSVRMLGTYNPARGGQWGVIVQRPERDAFASVIEMQATAERLGLGVMVLSLLVGILAARSITSPLDQLTETARAIAQRDFTRRADVRSRTEVGELAEGFNQMASTIQQYIGDLRNASEQNRQLFIDSIEMIAAAVDAKDPYTKGHSGRVAFYSLILVQELGLPADEAEKIRISATLHDVGKIGIEDRILKKPGVLSNDEFEIMKRHTIMGFEIVRQVKQLEEMLPGIRWHHEALNGQGYPDGITGDELPLMARIIAVADTFDAITTDRPYQAGRDFPTAIEILRKHAGSKYDPVVVDALLAAFTKGALRSQEQRHTLIAVPPVTV